MSFLLLLVIAIALNFIGSIDLSSLGEFHFTIVYKSTNRPERAADKQRRCCLPDKVRGAVFVCIFDALHVGCILQSTCRGKKMAGVSKGGGVPFGTRLCEAKCSVLYLSARLTGQTRARDTMRPCLYRQENGWEMCERHRAYLSPVFRERQQVYEAPAFSGTQNFEKWLTNVIFCITITITAVILFEYEVSIDE